MSSELNRREFLVHSAVAGGTVLVGCTAQTPQSAVAPIEQMKPADERPANSVRSIMRCFSSDIEDKGWYNDREFWKAYLTMLVTQRFNRVHLALGLGYDFPREARETYFHFPYPFFLKVPGYDVRATNLPDSERDNNLEMLRFISDEATARGLHFQLGLWTHAYQFANSPDVNHNIEGLTPDKHGPYCRDALTILLKECPNIPGITFRIHGESGVAEGSYEFWKMIFDGVVRSGRKVEIDMHAKGMNQEMIDIALATGMPVNISPKFWAEHMGLPYHQAAIRPVEMPTRERGEGLFANSSGSRSFLRYGYGDLLKEDRKYGIIHRIWPGTQRLLLWGDPVYTAAYSRASSFCGSLGCEIFEPLGFKGKKGSGLPGGREAYADPTLRSKYDFERYLYNYKLWGRLLYNPDTDPQTLQRDIQPAAATALASASRILPLFTTVHCPSAANNNYWPEMYVNMSLVEDVKAAPYTDTPVPKRFAYVSPLDPQLFSTIDGCATELISGAYSGKYSPIEVAQAMEFMAMGTAGVNEVTDRHIAIDVNIQAGLGRFFANKLRAGVLYAIYEKTSDPDALKQALVAYRAAREQWVRIIDVSKDVYVKDVSFGEGWWQRGNWSDRLAAINKDISLLEQRAASPTTQPVTRVPRAIQTVLDRGYRITIKLDHTPPQSLRPGQPLAIEIAAATIKGPFTLNYRHVNQAEAWRQMPMQADGSAHRATIPAEYTDSPYPMQYYFSAATGTPDAYLYPGFNPTWSNQPYFVVRHA